MCTGVIALVVIPSVILFIYSQNRIIKLKQQIHENDLAHHRELLNIIISSQENERRRIGHDLHDVVGGELSNLRFLISQLENTGIKDHELNPLAQTYKRLIDRIIENTRDISHNLSPPTLELFGFSTALEELKDMVCKGDRSFVTIIDNAGNATEKLIYQVALVLFRVLQELITNTVKHSGAKNIFITLFIENGLLVIHYTDNGAGYNPGDQKNKKGMGMQNIIYRLNMIDAKYIIKTAENEGFSMFISIDPGKQNLLS